MKKLKWYWFIPILGLIWFKNVADYEFKIPSVKKSLTSFFIMAIHVYSLVILYILI